MKTLLTALIILIPAITIAQDNVGERLSSEVAEAVQGYIDKSGTINGHTYMTVVPSEHLPFSLARTMIGMLQYSYDNMRVHRTWTRDANGYTLALIINDDPYLIHYDERIYTIIWE